jgi:hypothetical protein
LVQLLASTVAVELHEGCDEGRQVPRFHFGLLITALIVGGLVFLIKSQPVSPCEAGHCPNEDTLEYAHAAKAASERTMIAQAMAPSWGGGAFAAIVVLGIGWKAGRRKR